HKGAVLGRLFSVAASMGQRIPHVIDRYAAASISAHYDRATTQLRLSGPFLVKKALIELLLGTATSSRLGAQVHGRLNAYISWGVGGQRRRRPDQPHAGREGARAAGLPDRRGCPPPPARASGRPALARAGRRSGAAQPESDADPPARGDRRAAGRASLSAHHPPDHPVERGQRLLARRGRLHPPGTLGGDRPPRPGRRPPSPPA